MNGPIPTPPYISYNRDDKRRRNKPAWWRPLVRFFRKDFPIVLAILVGAGSWWQACLQGNALDNSELSAERQDRRDSVRDYRDSIRLVSQQEFNAAQLIVARKSIDTQSRFSRATLDSTGKQIAIASEMMQKQLRAYVSVRGDSAYSFPSNPNIFGIKFTVANDGYTPAYRVTISCGMAFKTVNPIFGRIITSGNYTKLPLNPGCSTDFVDLDTLTDSEMNSLRYNNGAVYEVGVVNYSDVFGQKRFTKFRFRTPSIGDRHSMHPDSTGNDAN